MIKKYFIEYIEDELELDFDKMSKRELKEEIEANKYDLEDDAKTHYKNYSKYDIKTKKQIIKDCEEELRRRNG